MTRGSKSKALPTTKFPVLYEVYCMINIQKLILNDDLIARLVHLTLARESLNKTHNVHLKVSDLGKLGPWSWDPSIEHLAARCHDVQTKAR